MQQMKRLGRLRLAGGWSAPEEESLESNGAKIESRNVGRPKSGVRRVQITISIKKEIVQAYDAEAERRWPGKARMRSVLMEEALEAHWQMQSYLGWWGEEFGGLPIAPTPSPAPPDARSEDDE